MNFRPLALLLPLLLALPARAEPPFGPLPETAPKLVLRWPWKKKQPAQSPSPDAVAKPKPASPAQQPAAEQAATLGYTPPAPAAAAEAAQLLQSLQAPVWDVSSAISYQPKDWQLRATGGFAWRSLGSLQFQMQDTARGAGLPLLVPVLEPSLGPAGAASGYGARRYRNGFVNPDVGTAIAGDTGFFSFQSDSQIQGGSLIYTGQGATSSQLDVTTLSQQASWSSDVSGGGPLIGLEMDGAVSPSLRLGAAAQFGFWQLEQAASGTRFLIQQRSENRVQQVTDAYDTAGAILPAAPYTGSFLGPGPIIIATPSRSVSEDVTHSVALLEDRITQELDLSLATLSLGPTLAWKQGQWSLQAAMGLALNIVGWQAEQREELLARVGHAARRTVASYTHEASGTTLLPGFYLQAGVDYQLSEHWSLRTFGRYDWARDLQEQVGPSQFRLDMAGWTVGAAAVYRF